ncbi:hypothetical protein NFA_40580 [Nocardia farcinica IFM 10152]|uniref:Uncharacterized protein n=1 Tax=Nocardia farcinica (strain IFM 10152) TaxID=247156 RepID=Q5YSD5_NOCFA|nr:hypothetical protein NFA_40580 [Nocardia farcinica IFM 10152]
MGGPGTAGPARAGRRLRARSCRPLEGHVVGRWRRTTTAAGRTERSSTSRPGESSASTVRSAAGSATSTTSVASIVRASKGVSGPGVTRVAPRPVSRRSRRPASAVKAVRSRSDSAVRAQVTVSPCRAKSSVSSGRSARSRRARALASSAMRSSVAACRATTRARSSTRSASAASAAAAGSAAPVVSCGVAGADSPWSGLLSRGRSARCAGSVMGAP